MNLEADTHQHVSTPPPRSKANVFIVGTGPAGIGIARFLRDLAISDVYMLERKQRGAPFRAGPQNMRLITPPFPRNAFGLTDFNATSFNSSPGFSLKREHLSGMEYAAYLNQEPYCFGLPKISRMDVRSTEPADNILLHTRQVKLQARFVIWASGQFQYPDDGEIEETEHRIDSSHVGHRVEHEGHETIVLGGTSLIEGWLDFDNNGHPKLTAQVEPAELTGLFLVGPEVRQNNQLFCFIYKFRQLFAVVARAISGMLSAYTSTRRWKPNEATPCSSTI